MTTAARRSAELASVIATSAFYRLEGATVPTEQTVFEAARTPCGRS
jgi:hypothetical protein